MGPIQGISPSPTMGPVTSETNQSNWQFRQATLPGAEPKPHIPRGKTELITKKIAQRVATFFKPLRHTLSVKYQLLRMLTLGYSLTFTRNVINNSLDQHDNSLKELSESVDYYQSIAGMTKQAKTIRPDLPLIKADVIVIFQFLLAKSGSDMAWSKAVFFTAVRSEDVTELSDLAAIINHIGLSKKGQCQDEHLLAKQTTDARKTLDMAPNETLNQQNVRRAYHRAQLKYHPDKLGSAYTSKIKEHHHQVQLAYEFLNEQLTETKPQAN